MEVKDIFKKIFNIVIVSILITLFSIVIFVCCYLIKPLSISEKQSHKYFIIEKGQYASLIAQNLYKDQIIGSPSLLRAVLFLLNKDEKIYYGEYEFTSRMNIYNLITKITTGDVTKYKFRIEDGETIAGILAKQNNHKKLINNIKNIDNLKNNLININKVEKLSLDIDLSKLDNLEGLFYPDTYYYTYHDNSSEIFIKSHKQIIEKLYELWSNRENNIYKTDKWYTVIDKPYKALILASIIEKEASDKDERELISGVIYNRLNNNMYLQLDPTVIYALGDKYNGSITKLDLKTDSPYNTYINKSLPPGPIGTVSVSSLRAAIMPKKTDFIYFVATGDGKHKFSVSLDEHNQAVNKYIKNNQEPENNNKQ